MAFVLGITGGIATGKSSVVQHFKGLGFPVVDADIIARHLLDKNTPVFNEVVKVFGTEILQENGEINRQLLGALVFNHPDKLQQLDELMAPFLREEIMAAIKKESHKQKLVIVDVPLMYEKGYDEWMDQVAVILSFHSLNLPLFKYIFDCLTKYPLVVSFVLNHWNYQIRLQPIIFSFQSEVDC